MSREREQPAPQGPADRKALGERLETNPSTIRGFTPSPPGIIATCWWQQKNSLGKTYSNDAEAPIIGFADGHALVINPATGMLMYATEWGERVAMSARFMLRFGAAK